MIFWIEYGGKNDIDIYIEFVIELNSGKASLNESYIESIRYILDQMLCKM